ncbi:MAG: hypothetical protein ACT4PP_13035 [Sporichthyaceae bacterium]
MMKKIVLIGIAVAAAKRLSGRGSSAATASPAWGEDVSPEPEPLDSWADEGGALIDGSPAQGRAPSP